MVPEEFGIKHLLNIMQNCWQVLQSSNLMTHNISQINTVKLLCSKTVEYVGEFYFSQAHSVCQTFCDSTSVCRGASVKNDIETANIRIAM